MTNHTELRMAGINHALPAGDAHRTQKAPQTTWSAPRALGVLRGLASVLVEQTALDRNSVSSFNLPRNTLKNKGFT